MICVTALSSLYFLSLSYPYFGSFPHCHILVVLTIKRYILLVPLVSNPIQISSIILVEVMGWVRMVGYQTHF